MGIFANRVESFVPLNALANIKKLSTEPNDCFTLQDWFEFCLLQRVNEREEPNLFSFYTTWAVSF